MVLKIEERRKAAGIKQNDFAKKIGCTAPTLCNWENGWADPPIRYLPRIAKALGCSIDDLFTKEAEE